MSKINFTKIIKSLVVGSIAIATNILLHKINGK